jgi:peptide/nickel transport system substrate-binding protein
MIRRAETFLPGHFMRKRFAVQGSWALALGLALLAAAPAFSAEVRLGLKGRITAIDPHFDNLASNRALSRHIFETLVVSDDGQRLRPGLAEAWRAVEETVWEFNLRRGVRFHDGTMFTADDVVFSINRVPNVPESPASFARHTRHIASMEKADAFTIRFKTDEPYPLLPHDLAQVSMLSVKAADGKTTAEIDAGDGALGTGPYRYLEWRRGAPAVLVRNNDYWGQEPVWDQVTVRTIASDGARLEALRAGEVDIIDSVPPALQKSFKKRGPFRLVRGISNRVICLFVDSNRQKSPFVTGVRKGNPLRDARVRKAISLAIDRNAVVKKVMARNAVPAGQLVAEGFFGHSRNLKPDKQDLRRAKRLLARAGYRRGFGLTLHAPNNRYLNVNGLAKTLAKGLTRIGIRTELDTKPRNIFFPLAAKREFSLLLAGWSAETGEASAGLSALLATRTPRERMGAQNFGGYSNRRLDTTLHAALRTMDEEKRERLLQEATEIAIRDYGLIPLHFERNTWALRKGLKLTPRTDGATLAMNVAPAP